MRRRVKRAPNVGQGHLAFTGPAGEQPAQTKRRVGGTCFVDPAPWHLRLGSVRLDEYLIENDFGWVVRLREELGRLDFSCLEQNYSGMGRAPYHPRLMLGLAVYGVLKGKSTLRELEELARLDLGAWWMTSGEQPDHSTIGDFLNRHVEQIGREFFHALVRYLAKRLGLKNTMVAGDGTVIEAAGSRFGLLRLEAAEQAASAAKAQADKHKEDADLAQQAENAEAVAQLAREREKERRAGGSKPGGAVVSAVDPEAVLQKCKDGRRRLSFKPSVLVYAEGLIVAQTVEPSSEPAAYDELLAQHAEIFGEDPKRVLWDAGLNNIRVLKEAADRGLDLLCPSGRTQGSDWERKGNKDKFGKKKFAYDAEGDRYLCPAGKWLHPGAWYRHSRTGHQVRNFRTRECGGCALRAQCVSGKGGRTVVRFEGEEYKEMMEAVLAQPRARQAYAERAPTVERVFAEIGCRQGLKRFRRVGRRGSALEFGLHCIAFNLKWAVRRLAKRAANGVFHHLSRPGSLWRIWPHSTVAGGSPALSDNFELRLAA